MSSRKADCVVKLRRVPVLWIMLMLVDVVLEGTNALGNAILANGCPAEFVSAMITL